MSRILPHEVAIRQIFVLNNEGLAEVINIEGVICKTLTVNGKKFDPSSADYATIGGITLKDKTIIADSLTFDIADGVIDMGGATLTNVGGIVSNPNDYRAVYNPVIVPSGGTIETGIVSLPAGNVVCTIYVNFAAISNSGLTIVGQLGYRVRKYLAVVDIVPCGYSGTTSDDVMLDGITITASQSGPGSVSLSVHNPSPVEMNVRVTAVVTILKIGGI